MNRFISTPMYVYLLETSILINRNLGLCILPKIFELLGIFIQLLVRTKWKY